MSAATTTTRWGDKEARRRDILDAARRLLERDGYERLNMRDVARGAGVSPGSVYNYFGSREELFATLYAERLEEFHAEIVPACAAATTPEQLFVEIANRYLAMYRVFGRDVNVWALLVEAERLPAEIARPLVEAAERVMATIQDALARFAADRGIALSEAGNSRLAMPFLWTTLTGLADHFTGMRHALHPYTWEELTAFAARTLVAGLTATEPEGRSS
jgi:AcrR family transcriptional regulator